jgi:predicted N-acetyltransferase YhbS
MATWIRLLQIAYRCQCAKVAISLQYECWDDYYSDCQGLWKAQYEEFGDKRVEFGPNVPSYQFLFKAGVLRILTARDEGQMIAYVIAILHRHMHYKLQVATLDTVYIDPSRRKSKLLIRLLDRLEKDLRIAGVEKIVMVSPVENPLARLFKRLGFREEAVMYHKLLGG